MNAKPSATGDDKRQNGKTLPVKRKAASRLGANVGSDACRRAAVILEVLAGEGATYDPGDRRDPFRSLATARQNEDRRGPRPEGIPGLMIDDVEVTGIFMTAQGAVAHRWRC